MRAGYIHDHLPELLAVDAMMVYRSKLRFLLEAIEGIVVLLTVLVSWPVSRLWLRNVGSDESERERTWPGDSFAPAARHVYTRAIDIAASSECVWSWVIQFGLGRAGFYSYELLERLAGIPVRNVESIVPEYQTMAVGDEIKLHPKAPGIPVGAVEQGRHICYGNPGDVGESTTEPRRSWSMYVLPGVNQMCRLVLRGCIESRHKPTLLQRLGLAFEAPIDFVMEQRMLRTIRRLAERMQSEVRAYKDQR